MTDRDESAIHLLSEDWDRVVYRTAVTATMTAGANGRLALGCELLRIASTQAQASTADVRAEELAGLRDLAAAAAAVDPGGIDRVLGAGGLLQATFHYKLSVRTSATQRAYMLSSTLRTVEEAKGRGDHSAAAGDLAKLSIDARAHHEHMERLDLASAVRSDPETAPSGLPGVTEAQYAVMDKSERRQRHLAMPMRGDDDPVTLTSLQVSKCAAIVQTALEGHVLWAEHAKTAATFWQVTAAVAAGAVSSPTPAELWSELAGLPWPPQGTPRSQPDVDQG